MTNPMIERVAKAVIAAIEKQCEERGDYMRDDHDGEICVDGYLRPADIARAAIEAMRGPTEAMMLANSDCAGPDDGATIADWNAMIDAALKED